MNEKTENLVLDKNAVENAVSLATLNVRLEQIEDTLKKLEKALNGNGQDGVLVRVARLEEKINGTWKFALIIGWLLNFLVAVGAVAVAILKH